MQKPNQLITIAALVVALVGCAAAAPRPMHGGAALAEVMAAADYGAAVAEAAGAARGGGRIDQAAYQAVLAALEALDGAWRRAAATLAAGPPEAVERALGEMRREKAALGAAWREHGPR